MSIWTMVWHEIAYRRLNFVFGVAGVTGAIAVLIGLLLGIDVHNARSDRIALRKEAETKASREAFSSDIRHAMQRLGYNAVILPKDQKLGDWYADDYAKKTMPESSASRLKTTKQLVDRYLPQLRRRLEWTEKKWTILVIGLGQEQILDTSVCDERPLVDNISPGQCIVGHELQKALGLKQGQEITLLGKRFRIARCKKELGTKDDITIWLTLNEAQQLLDLKDQINEILIVEHISVWGNLHEVQRRIERILPDSQVVEMASETASRAHARSKVADEAAAAIEQARQQRILLRRQRTRMLATLLPLGAMVCACWIGLLAYFNVRQRTQETGILMAIGFSPATVRAIYLQKAAILGAAGGLLGFLVAAGLVLAREPDFAANVGRVALLLMTYLALSVAVGVVMSLLGSWLPVQWAVALDPSEVLHER